MTPEIPVEQHPDGQIEIGRGSFDPTRFLTKVSGRPYLEVKYRLVWLRDTHPGAQIKTEMVQHQGQHAVFRAEIILPPQRSIDPITGEILDDIPAWSASATGWGSEASDDFGDYLEKAETKALGRALAALGFGTQFCPDYDFGADQQRVVDSPAHPAGQRRGNPAGGSQEATPRQIKYLYAVSREIGLSSEEIEERSQDAFGCAVSELSRRDISALIEQIQAGRPTHLLAT